MKRSKVIENAFDEIDTKFIEEPMERRCAREEKPADQKVLKMRRVWIVAAAAAVLAVSLAAGGVFLSQRGLFKASKESEGKASEQAATPNQNENLASTPEERILLLVAEKSGGSVSDGILRYEENGYCSSDFAPYYGGAYRNAEGQFVVCLTEAGGKEALQAGKEKLSGEYDLFEEVAYSYANLMDCMTDLMNYSHSDDYRAQYFKIIGSAIDAEKNVVLVTVTSRDEAVLSKIRSLVGTPDALQFAFSDPEDWTAKEADAPSFYGVLPCERDVEMDEFVRTKADEMLESVVLDPAVYHAGDRDLNDLYILAPFRLWQETANGIREVEDGPVQYPVASNGRIICTIIVLRAGGELHYNVSDMYVQELNQVCGDNRNRVVVFDEEAAESGDKENAVRIVFRPDDDGSEHAAEENVFLDLSGKYID